MLPSLNALRAFDEAARSGSFKAAAEALNVSPTAISHHIRGLEQDLGVALFDRDGRRITLTLEGHQLAQEVAAAFEQLTRAVDRTRRSRKAQAIRIAAGPFFAARWLMPRLATFWTEHPDISLEVVPVPLRLQDRDVDADVVIEWGEAANDTDRPLLVLHPVAIASPDLIRRLGRPEHPRDLLNLPLIHQRDTSSWQDWFVATEVCLTGPLRGAVFEDANAVLRGAVDGQGITLGWMPLIESDLARGSVVKLFDETVVSEKQYHIRLGHRGVRNARAQAVVAWLRAQGAATGFPPHRPE